MTQTTSSRLPEPRWIGPRRALLLVGLAVVLAFAYVLRGVLVPLFFAFLLAYALDPFVDRLEAMKVPRALGAILVLFTIFALFVGLLVFAVPMFVDEIRAAAAELPSELQALESRIDPWFWGTLHLKIPHSMSDLSRVLGDKAQAEFPTMLSAVAVALFGTLSYVSVLFSALIVPFFSLYLLIDFDRIVARLGELVPRRWVGEVTDVARQVHRTLGGYVRGQLTANIVLGALYATGLRLVDIRLAVPIGVATGMLAFVPYVGFFTGLGLALMVAVLDWHGLGTILGVLTVMLGVQVLDGTFITPRIVGRSVGLAPLEVLVTMMAAASLFGFFGVLLAVPLGAVIKILIQRGVKAYLRSEFYRERPGAAPRG
ncbi:MAG TPA: AI-2E family transporter [Polyangiaceae bacterium]|jgi:predicted PurR-regulated permease PerM